MVSLLAYEKIARLMLNVTFADSRSIPPRIFYKMNFHTFYIILSYILHSYQHQTAIYKYELTTQCLGLRARFRATFEIKAHST